MECWKQIRKAGVLSSSLLLAALAAGCGIESPGGDNHAGPGKRPQTLALSPEQELEAGRQAYREALHQYRAKILPASSPEVERARTICKRIVSAAGIRPLQKEMNLQLRRYRFEWEVNVVRSPEINAFCLPGGKIIVFTGIMEFARSDDELAAVLAHEIAHALAHHASERVAREQSLGNSGLGGLRNDRMQEEEADHIGLFLMTFAGFNPEAAVQFWERMEKSNHGSQRPEILSDHPSDARRVHDMRQWAPKAIAAKQAYEEGRVVSDSD